MVSPIYLVVVALLVAFLLGIVDRISRRLSIGLTLGTLAWMAGLAGVWFVFLATGTASEEIFTAGFSPPFSINLRLGVIEAGVATFVNLAFLGSVVVLARRLLREHMGAQVLLLMMAMGTNGLILTRDLFNVFVFLEITAIATYGMLALHDDERGLSAGFKYVIAGGLSSALFLIGTIYLYRITGTLNIDGMIEAAGAGGAADPGGVLAAGAGFVAIFLVVLALLVELKPFPANGWALDVYQGAAPSVSALISVATSGGILLALFKVMPMIPEALLAVVAGVGVLTFGFSNLIGLRQGDVRRMLGYSSTAQMGLVVAVLSFSGLQGWSAPVTLLVAGGILVNHLLAKGGLFWITSLRDLKNLSGVARKFAGRRGLLIITGILVAALAGLPPFPTFFAKWTMVGNLLAGGEALWIVVVLLGSLFEAAYLFRFLGAGVSSEALRFSVLSHGSAERAGAPVTPDGAAPLPSSVGSASDIAAVNELAVARRGVATAAPGLFALLALAGGIFVSWVFGFRELLLYLPVLAGVALWLLDWLPAKLKALISIAAMLVYGWTVYPLLSGVGLVFLSIFAGGGAIVTLAMVARTRRSRGLFPLVVTLILSMTALLAAESSLGFFLSFEVMTFSSYLLLLRRGTATRAAQRYLVFSLGGAFLLMVGLILLSRGGAQFAVPHLSSAPLLPSAATMLGPVVGNLEIFGASAAGTAALAGDARVLAIALISLGFLVKAGAVGVHIWLPGAYAEAEEDISPIFSGVLSKVPVLGMLMVALVVLVGAGVSVGASVGAEAGGLVVPGGVGLLTALGWVGAATALFGALLAVYQQDVKYLLAYSSMSQLGYIFLAIAIGTQLGWTTGLYLSILHFIFKGMLFLAIAGVVLRTGTRSFRELGGLIKRMPFSFISSLMAIIAVSGVPPLAGFGGKWMIYTALFERGWYFQGAVAFFASTIAFLYLFKFIHTVFLGQLKDEHREVKEAPIWLIFPQMLLAAGLMVVSMYPNVILQPLLAVTGAYLGSTTGMEGYTVFSTLGYWNGNLVMYVTMGVFIVPLVWLMVVMRRPQKVKQFNIVYAAERPERPETTHFAHAFFWHYEKALGFLSRPGVIAFWNGVREAVAALASAFRRLYSGNGQTYALHIVLFAVALYLITGGLS